MQRTPVALARVAFAIWTVVATGALGRTALGQIEELRTAIYVMKPSGTELRKVVQLDDYKEHALPVWSHDGTRIAFEAWHGTSRVKKVFVVKVDGSGLQEICEGESPDWSPDDKQLLFHSEAGPNSPAGTYVQNLDGKSRAHVADGHGGRWSPDGSRVAYTNGQGVFVLDVVSDAQRNIIGAEAQYVWPGLDWAPDGKRLAVVVRAAKPKELWIVEVGAERPQWKSRLAINLDPRVAWSPDGKQIIFSASRRLGRLEPDGKGTYPLPNQRGNSVEPAWSPDGQWLVFAGNHP